MRRRVSRQCSISERARRLVINVGCSAAGEGSTARLGNAEGNYSLQSIIEMKPNSPTLHTATDTAGGGVGLRVEALLLLLHVTRGRALGQVLVLSLIQELLLLSLKGLRVSLR